MAANAAETTEKSQPRDASDASVLSAVKWDDFKMATHFANVVNIQSTLEQVDLFFGTNQTWNVPSDRRVQVELNNRIILRSACRQAAVARFGRRSGGLRKPPWRASN